MIVRLYIMMWMIVTRSNLPVQLMDRFRYCQGDSSHLKIETGFCFWWGYKSIV